MAPQFVFAPFTRADTLRIAIQLVPGTVSNAGKGAKGDCDKLPSSATHVRVLDTTSFAGKAVAANIEVTRITIEYRRMHGNGPNADTVAAVRYRSATVRRLDSAMRTARTRSARELAAYELLRFANFTDEPITAPMRARIRAALPPESPWWLMRRQVFEVLVPALFGPSDTAWKLADHPAERRKVEDYYNRMIVGLGEPEATSEIKFALIRLAYSARDPGKAEALLADLLQTQPNYFYSGIAQEMWDPNRPLRTGVQMPAFAFAGLPDTARRVTNATLIGKYTLIEFWTTWCGPCVRGMPGLHAVAKKYAGRDFQILSISADSTPEAVKVFRQKRYPMPWINAYATGATRNEQLAALGVTAFPRAVLVDPTGKIIAVDAETERNDLTAILERMLPPVPPSVPPAH